MSHSWGDSWFKEHGDNLYAAMRYIKWFVKLSGCTLYIKEKYGTIRYEYLCPPGSSYYNKSKIDALLEKVCGCKEIRWNTLDSGTYLKPRVQWTSSYLWRKWRQLGMWSLSVAIKKATKKWPDVKAEILDDYDAECL